MKILFQVWSCLLLAAVPVFAADQDEELKPLQGRWEVIELSEDGHVIPKEAIREWLPSGGKLEISDNAIITVSPQDGKRHAKIFTIDATQFPKGLEIATREKKEATGIYRIADGQLVVCLIDPEDGPRPEDFSAKKGSKRMLMVLKHVGQAGAGSKEPAPEEPRAKSGDGVSAKVLTDAEVTKLMNGVWRYTDEAGALVMTMNGDGTWSSIREVQEMRLLQRVFVRTPISSGKWDVRNGTLTFHCTSSIYASRVNQQLPFTVRSVSDRDFIFVDYMGRLGKAVRIK
ncbi:MAG: TIGR03067 domain-containing protein [Planctomycetaceae bacterium]